MASESASYGIRVNALAPGNIHTPQTAARAKIPQILERNLANTPMKRFVCGPSKPEVFLPDFRFWAEPPRRCWQRGTGPS
jgi:NAD(P)-dependent dehydrogenase (short-subunit alcohol dehydrogenase family)